MSNIHQIKQRNGLSQDSLSIAVSTSNQEWSLKLIKSFAASVTKLNLLHIFTVLMSTLVINSELSVEVPEVDMKLFLMLEVRLRRLPMRK